MNNGNGSTIKTVRLRPLFSSVGTELSMLTVLPYTVARKVVNVGLTSNSDTGRKNSNRAGDQWHPSTPSAALLLLGSRRLSRQSRPESQCVVGLEEPGRRQKSHEKAP